MEAARLELVPDPRGGQEPVWRITFDLAGGTVTLPVTYRIASAAEQHAREHARTLGYRVHDAHYSPASMVLELHRFAR
jgi:hypothetical protein